jgi:hypothetical protein
MTWRRNPEPSFPAGDPFFAAVRSCLAVERAPDTLRQRIGAMLALEQYPAGPGEPCREGPRWNSGESEVW